MSENRRDGTDLDEERPIRDLSDFCLRWSECRPVVRQGLAGLERDRSAGHADEFASIVNWLCLLADRVCLDFQESTKSESGIEGPSSMMTDEIDNDGRKLRTG